MNNIVQKKKKHHNFFLKKKFFFSLTKTTKMQKNGEINEALKEWKILVGHFVPGKVSVI